MTNESNERKEMTAEEKGRLRVVALKNLNSKGLTDLAASYFVNQSGAYGEAGDSAVEQFKYLPAVNYGAKSYDFESGDEVDMITNSLLGSRQDGKRYTGTLSEFKVMKDCATMVQRSLGMIKIKDILELTGSDIDVKENYKDKYFSDLFEGSNEDKKIANQIIGDYMKYFATIKVLEALGESANNSKGNLEKILTE